MNYENLPVYKSTFDLLVQVYRITGNMQREYRFTLAEQLKLRLQELLSLIYQANVGDDKLKLIGVCRKKLVDARVLFQVAQELNQFKDKQSAQLSIKVSDISKQLQQWETYFKKQGDHKN